MYARTFSLKNHPDGSFLNAPLVLSFYPGNADVPENPDGYSKSHGEPCSDRPGGVAGKFLMSPNILHCIICMLCKRRIPNSRFSLRVKSTFVTGSGRVQRLQTVNDEDNWRRADSVRRRFRIDQAQNPRCLSDGSAVASSTAFGLSAFVLSGSSGYNKNMQLWKETRGIRARVLLARLSSIASACACLRCFSQDAGILFHSKTSRRFSARAVRFFRRYPSGRVSQLL